MKKLLFLSGLSLTFFACSTSSSGEAEVKDLNSLELKVSYAAGLDMGANLRNLDFGVDKNALIQGIIDGLDTARKPLLTREEMEASFNEIQMQIQAKSQKKLEEAAAGNVAKGAAFLAEEAKKPGMQKTASGMVYEVLVMGKGPKPSAENTVSVNYEGTLIDGTVFDSSYERGQPATFPLNGVIRGWTEGLQLMPVGSTFRFIIPADLAYGTNPPPGSPIQPGSTLVFKVELLNIEKSNPEPAR
jgi:FKBP-type peptidyl-prolyl cis-trans isomerase